MRGKCSILMSKVLTAQNQINLFSMNVAEQLAAIVEYLGSTNYMYTDVYHSRKVVFFSNAWRNNLSNVTIR